MPWTNALPARGLSGVLLWRYWAWVLKTRADRKKSQDSYTSKHQPTSGMHRWRRERVTQMHMFEAVLALLHSIVAPGAAYLCGAKCTHLAEGATP